MSGPLDKIRVLDLSRVLAGPWASQLLADYGADVIKIERPASGDDTRHWGPPWLKDKDGNETDEAAYFLSANRNKRSVTVNLAHGAGQQVIRDLARQADILIENFKPGTLARFSLDYESLRKVRPELIYCSISAYGQTGSKANEPGYDAMMQASGGLMSLTGDAEAQGGQPQKVGVAVADIMAGMYAATAILAALAERGQHGPGQHIDLSLFDSQVAWLANQNMNYLIGGEVPARYGSGHPNLVPYQSFATADGAIMVAVGNDRQFADFAACIERPELADEPRFSSNEQRVAHRQSLVGIIDESLRTQSSQHWLQRLARRAVPAGPVRNLREVFEDPYTGERKLVRFAEHPLAGPVPTVVNPVRFSKSESGELLAPPTLGQHTFEVLTTELGYSGEKIQALADDGAI